MSEAPSVSVRNSWPNHLDHPATTGQHSGRCPDRPRSTAIAIAEMDVCPPKKYPHEHESVNDPFGMTLRNKNPAETEIPGDSAPCESRSNDCS